MSSSITNGGDHDMQASAADHTRPLSHGGRLSAAAAAAATVTAAAVAAAATAATVAAAAASAATATATASSAATPAAAVFGFADLEGPATEHLAVELLDRGRCGCGAVHLDEGEAARLAA